MSREDTTVTTRSQVIGNALSATRALIQFANVPSSLIPRKIVFQTVAVPQRVIGNRNAGVL